MCSFLWVTRYLIIMSLTIDDKSVIIITDNKFILPILSTYDSNPLPSENFTHSSWTRSDKFALKGA